MSLNNSQRAGFPTELRATMTGSSVAIGTLQYTPVIIIFDNQGTADVEISIDGTNTWKTFTGGEALVLDLRANHGVAPTFAIDKGTTFFGNGASGAFSISYLYAVS
jgi:hypothetical protein